MLQRMTITGGTCFGPDPMTVDGLKLANFFYGPNGSGKTTISRAFAGGSSVHLKQEFNDDVPMNVQVYNRDFMNQMLRECDRIPGVFVLGEHNVEAQKRIDQILKVGGERDQATDRYERNKTSFQDAQKRQNDAKEELKITAWSKYRALVDKHEALLPAFIGERGVNRNKDMLVTRLLERNAPSTGQIVPKLDELLARAAAVFNTDATTRPLFAEIQEFNWDGEAGFKHLEKKIVGSSEVSLSELVEKLGNEDWVQAGRHYIDVAGGLCPFCQQTAPKDLARQLEEMFDDRYTKQVEELKQLSDAYLSWFNTMNDCVTRWSVESNNNLDEALYEKACRSWESIFSKNMGLLERKLGAPSELVRVSTSSSPVENLNSIIKEANAKIETHNKLVNSRKKAKPELVQDCWTYLADVLLRDDLDAYRKKSVGLQKGVHATEQKMNKEKYKLDTLDDEVRRLQRSVESSQPVIDEINYLLKKSGFTSFHISNSADLENGYMLTRDEVSFDERSLSEGERSFIAFLYYYYRLNARENAGARILAVVDDPISSLDSDALFIVSVLVRNLISRALSKSDHVTQVIVLTHNVYFYKEITQIKSKDRESDRCYYVIRKRNTGGSVVEPHTNNPISTEYERLWSEVRRATRGEEMSVIGLENILRRILENYFRIAGGIWEDEIEEYLDPADQLVLRSLFNWVNEGSHGVFENLHYSPSEITQKQYLEVFEHVFSESGHGAHYEMMMRNKNS